MREEDVLVGGFIQKNQSVVWDHAEVETKFLLYIWVGGVCGGYGGGKREEMSRWLFSIFCSIIYSLGSPCRSPLPLCSKQTITIIKKKKHYEI